MVGKIRLCNGGGRFGNRSRKHMEVSVYGRNERRCCVFCSIYSIPVCSGNTGAYGRDGDRQIRRNERSRFMRKNIGKMEIRRLVRNNRRIYDIVVLFGRGRLGDKIYPSLHRKRQNKRSVSIFRRIFVADCRADNPSSDIPFYMCCHRYGRNSFGNRKSEQDTASAAFCPADRYGSCFAFASECI